MDEAKHQEHPILTLTRQMIRCVDGRHHLSAEGAILIEVKIIEHLGDPELPEVIRTLFGLVAVLEEDLKAPLAAYALTASLARLHPRLAALWGMQKVPTEADRAKLRAQLGLGASSAEKLSGPPPVGALKVSGLAIPPMPRPSLAGVRPAPAARKS